MRQILIAAAVMTLLILLIRLSSNPARGLPEPPNDPWFQEQVVQNPRPVIVDFYATWCGPCKIIAQQLEQLDQEFDGKISIVKVDIEERRELAQHYGINAIPVILLVQDGKSVAMQRGAGGYAQLKKFVQGHLNL